MCVCVSVSVCLCVYALARVWVTHGERERERERERGGEEEDDDDERRRNRVRDNERQRDEAIATEREAGRQTQEEDKTRQNIKMDDASAELGITGAHMGPKSPQEKNDRENSQDKRWPFAHPTTSHPLAPGPQTILVPSKPATPTTLAAAVSRVRSQDLPLSTTSQIQIRSNSGQTSARRWRNAICVLPRRPRSSAGRAQPKERWPAISEGLADPVLFAEDNAGVKKGRKGEAMGYCTSDGFLILQQKCSLWASRRP